MYKLYNKYLLCGFHTIAPLRMGTPSFVLASRSLCLRWFWLTLFFQVSKSGVSLSNFGSLGSNFGSLGSNFCPWFVRAFWCHFEELLWPKSKWRGNFSLGEKCLLICGDCSGMYCTLLIILWGLGHRKGSFGAYFIGNFGPTCCNFL